MEVVAEFKECPDCKVDARLMQSIADVEMKKGNMSEGTVGFCKLSVYTNVDLTKRTILGGRYPSARVFEDICMKCGRTYVVKIEKGHATPPTHQGMPPTFE